MCGAVSGALMVIGLAVGAATAGDQTSREHSYAVTKEFLHRFEDRHGAVVCRELLGVNIGTPDGREAAMRDGLFRTRCPEFVRDAADFVADLT